MQLSNGRHDGEVSHPNSAPKNTNTTNYLAVTRDFQICVSSVAGVARFSFVAQFPKRCVTTNPVRASAHNVTNFMSGTVTRLLFIPSSS